jgi:hypothetical protein
MVLLAVRLTSINPVLHTRIRQFFIALVNA